MLNPNVTAYAATPGAPRLLVVDDDDVMRQLATCTLQQAGFDVVEAGESEALFAAPQQTYTRELLAAAFL